MGAQEGRQLPRDAVQKRRATRGVEPLCLLDLLPIEENLLGGIGLDIAEHVGMAPDEFFGDRPEDVRDAEEGSLLGHARVEDDLEQHVAELFAELPGISFVYRLQDLVRLFDEVRFDALVGLLPIPGATVLASEPRHDPDQLSEQFVDGLGHGVPPGQRKRSAVSFHSIRRAALFPDLSSMLNADS